MPEIQSISSEVQRRGTYEKTTPADLPASCVVYAIGDIHGREDLLRRLWTMISEDAGQNAGNSILVLLGDYIDRGEQSREVIDFCLNNVSAWPGEVIFLKGNHEDALLSFLDEPIGGDVWLRYGGLATMMSYGVGGAREHMSENELVQIAEELTEALPSEHLDFLERLQTSYRVGNYFFCHAGFDPDTVPELQTSHVLMWGAGREDVDLSLQPLTIVHGHYVHGEPVQYIKRIGIDTGAYFSGRLTAVKLQQGKISFINT